MKSLLLKFLFFLVIVLLINCFKSPTTTPTPTPTAEYLRTVFESNRASFEALKSMIKADARGPSAFSVGTDHIGNYWKQHSGEWSHENDYQKKLQLNDVLEAVSLTPERYEEYTKIFTAIGADRVTYFIGAKYYSGENISIIMYRSGLGVSGYSIEINHGENPPEPYGRRDRHEDFMEIIPLVDGWYIEINCT